MLDGQVLAFALALVLSVTPGPDMALVLRNSVRGGRPAALRTIFGIGVGLLGWAAATALGVAAVLAASATVFTVLKILGGIYLVYLGIQTMLALRRGERPDPGAARLGSPFRQGLVTNLLKWSCIGIESGADRRDQVRLARVSLTDQRGQRPPAKTRLRARSGSRSLRPE